MYFFLICGGYLSAVAAANDFIICGGWSRWVELRKGEALAEQKAG